MMMSAPGYPVGVYGSFGWEDQGYVAVVDGGRVAWPGPGGGP
jgi:hypothetical protein